MMDGLDFILTVASVVIGIMLLTGHGSVFMSGGDAVKRKKIYDEKKMEKASGIALLAIGVATGIDHFTTSFAAKIGYIVVLVVILIVLIFYIKTKCKK